MTTTIKVYSSLTSSDLYNLSFNLVIYMGLVAWNPDWDLQLSKIASECTSSNLNPVQDQHFEEHTWKLIDDDHNKDLTLHELALILMGHHTRTLHLFHKLPNCVDSDQMASDSESTLF